MHPRLRGVRLRAAHLITRRSSPGRDQAHPRRTAPLSRAAVLVSVLVGSGLLLVLRPGDVTRAT
ncbi:MAG: hypothetical protein HY262_09920, partial [Chloroflexi bacterium]|nr:hypothetical protein [Chloroflexota bacterium]